MVLQDRSKYLRLATSDVELPESLPAEADQSVVLGFRPKHLRVEAKGAFSVTLEVVEPTGNETHLTCSLGNVEIRLIEDAESTASPPDMSVPHLSD